MLVLGKRETGAVGLCEPDAILAHNEEGAHLSRITVVVMNSHKPPPELGVRARQYLTLVGTSVKLSQFLGSGTDGAVWATNKDTAIKVFHRSGGYFNERDTYQRLADFGVTESIDGFWIPKMHYYDDRLMVVEMDIMHQPPFIIDFAKVRLNSDPDFSEETLADNERQGRDLFEDRWPAVASLLSALESYLIYYLDPKPQNIVFPGQL